jgi:hypothetical protein
MTGSRSFARVDPAALKMRDRWIQLAELAELFGLSEESMKRVRQKAWFSPAAADALCDPRSPGIGAVQLVESSTACGPTDSCQSAAEKGFPAVSLTQSNVKRITRARGDRLTRERRGS